MKSEIVKISLVKLNPNNPRIIKDEKFQKLVQSIKDFPKMLELRPIVVNDDMVVLGGNMRLRACKEAGLKEVPIIRASDLSDDEQKQFIIKDNNGFGEWDWDILANEWDADELNEWGLDLPGGFNGDEDKSKDEGIEEEKEYFAVVIVAYENVNDLDKITALYELDNVDMSTKVKNEISLQKKMYVFKQ